MTREGASLTWRLASLANNKLSYIPPCAALIQIHGIGDELVAN